ncbi:MAG: isoprenylcysteine carboxylmethyltransferase family protein [Candidatus Micrarchaeia archaeon]
MTERRLAGLDRKVLVRLLAAPIAIAALLFVPAGTLDYWQAWLYCAVIFVPLLFVVAYLHKRDPGLLERRMKLKEKQRKQGTLVLLASAVFLIGFILPGLDQRFHWTTVPPEVSIAANAVVLLGYLLNALVLKENSYASRVIEVVKKQKTVTTGPYAVVRHPMYTAMLVMFLATPIALGSYAALVAFLPLPFLLAARAKDEEELLARKLAGYKAYCRKTRYRLVPYVW